MITNRIQSNLIALSNQIGRALKELPSNVVQPREKLVMMASVSREGLINDEDAPPEFVACFSVDARFDGPPAVTAFKLLNTYTNDRNVPSEEHPALFTQTIRTMQRFYNSEN